MSSFAGETKTSPTTPSLEWVQMEDQSNAFSLTNNCLPWKYPHPNDNQHIVTVTSITSSMILLQPEKIPIEYKTAHGITDLAKGGRVTEDNWLRIYSFLQPSYFTRIRLKCLCGLFNDVEELISNYKYNKWTVNMIAQDITADKKVTVTQGTAVGTLRTALTGTEMTSVVIDAAFGVVFQDNLDVVIGTGGTAATITHVNITSATIEPNSLPLFSPLEPIPLYTSFPHPNYASLRGLTTCLNALSKKEPDNVPSLLLIADGIHDEQGEYVVIDFPLTIIGESKDGCTIIGGLKMEGKKIFRRQRNFSS